MSQPINVRLASISDAALLAELGERTFAETFAADNRPEDMTAYFAEAFGVTQQRAELVDPDSTTFIAGVEGCAAGYAQLHAGAVPSLVTGARPVQLARLYVLREWLGRGVGALLMRRCIDEAHAAGRLTLWLGVWERNERAQAFYRKWGFKVIGEHSFQLGADTQVDLLMERAL